MAQFIKTIQNFAFKKELWSEGAKIVVGVSGGPDSVCLLDVLSVLAKKHNFKLHVAHVNYGLRGKDSDRDEVFVRKIVDKYAWECSVLKPKKETYKGNLENCLRNIRYDFFEKIRKEKKFDFVAVAHNQDDQAETVLMRVLRGAGLNGLSSMKPKTGFLLRPLLGKSKAEILAYLKEKKLPFCIDKTNLKPDFLRNKIRLKLLPYLEKEYNAAVKRTIADWSLNVADDYEYIELAAKKTEANFFKDGKISFKSTIFLQNHPALQRQILRGLLGKLLGTTLDIESNHIEEILKIIKSEKSKTQKKTFLGLNISKKSDNITIFCQVK